MAMDNHNHMRSPKSEFEIGDLIGSKLSGETLIDNQASLDMVKEKPEGIYLLAFDEPVLGRLRILQTGEPLTMLGSKALVWIGMGYTPSNNDSETVEEDLVGEYVMPEGIYEKWKSIMDEPYVLIKDGWFYYLNDCGYTQSPLLANLYTKKYAESYAERGYDTEAHPISKYFNKDSIEKIDQHIENLEAIKTFLEQHERQDD